MSESEEIDALLRAKRLLRLRNELLWERAWPFLVAVGVVGGICLLFGFARTFWTLGHR